MELWRWEKEKENHDRVGCCWEKAPFLSILEVGVMGTHCDLGDSAQEVRLRWKSGGRGQRSVMGVKHLLCVLTVYVSLVNHMLRPFAHFSVLFIKFFIMSMCQLKEQ